MTTMGHLSVWRWKDVSLGGCLFCNFDFFFFFCFVYLSHCASLYLIKGYWWIKMWSQFSIFDRTPPSSCEKAAVCFTASAMTYQQTYFRWLVLHAVIQWQEKTCSSCMIFFSSFLSHFLHWICSDFLVGSSSFLFFKYYMNDNLNKWGHLIFHFGQHMPTMDIEHV